MMRIMDSQGGGGKGLMMYLSRLKANPGDQGIWGP